MELGFLVSPPQGDCRLSGWAECDHHVPKCGQERQGRETWSNNIKDSTHQGRIKDARSIRQGVSTAASRSERDRIQSLQKKHSSLRLSLAWQELRLLENYTGKTAV